MKKTFSRLLAIEIKKAIKNKFFIATLGIATTFSLFSAWYMIDHYRFQTFLSSIDGNPMTNASSLYNHWIGGEAMSLGFTLFFTLLPLIAVLPYGWSYFIEDKNGYVKTVVIRSNKWQYFLSKYLATFIAGGLVILIPLVVNFLLVASFVPAITPSMVYSLRYPVMIGSLWSTLFYTYPLIFVLLYVILNFIFAGLFATMSLAVSFFLRNRIAIILTPFFLIMTLHYSRTFLAYRYYNEISPINYLHATCVENAANAWIITAQGLLFFVLTFGITMKLGVKREIL